MAYLWQFTIASFQSVTSISGTLLSSAPKQGKTLYRLLSSYFTRPLAQNNIKLEINGQFLSATTDRYGRFEVMLDTPLTEPPEIQIFYKNTPLKPEQNYPIFFPYSTQKIGVISDLDDTVLLSHTASNTKRVGTLFFVPPHKRKAIFFTKELIGLVHKEKGGIYYVSKSESNLFYIISSFIRHQGLPEGLLILSPYRTLSDLLTKTKEANFKLNHIDFIIRNSPNKKFVLFGDDTQKDMDIYKTIVRRFPRKIVRIYIRMTASKLSKTKLRKWNELTHVFPNTVLFTKNMDVAHEKEYMNQAIKTL